MSDNATLDACMIEALKFIENFIAETTGQKPTPQELANALKRYFVLNEIKAHIVMEREESSA